MRSPELNNPRPSGSTDDGGGGETRGVDPLRAALDEAVADRFPGRAIAGVERRPAPYRSSRWLEYVTVHLDHGTAVPLVYKDFVRTVPGSEAHRVKPAEVMDATRESWVYRHVLRDVAVRGSAGESGPPLRWCDVEGPGARPVGLVLERVEGVPLTEVGDAHAWHAAARWLARFHARRTPPRPAPGPHYRDYRCI